MGVSQLGFRDDKHSIATKRANSEKSWLATDPAVQWRAMTDSIDTLCPKIGIFARPLQVLDVVPISVYVRVFQAT